MIYFTNQKEARLCGYTHCTACSRILEIYQECSKEASKYAEEHGLIVEFYDDAILIDNEKSSWKIVFDTALHGLTLYHANSETHVKYENGKVIHNYHLQNYKSEKSILEMMKYIVEHDIWKEEHADEYKAAREIKAIEHYKKDERKHYKEKHRRKR